MRNIDSFVTKTYPLRSWIEKTYPSFIKKASKSSNSVYYSHNLTENDVLRIRISDHISKVHYLSIIVNSDMMNEKKITYIVMLPSNNKIPMIVSSFSQLKSILSYYIFSELHKNIIPENVIVHNTKKEAATLDNVFNSSDDSETDIDNIDKPNHILLAEKYNISEDVLNSFTKAQIKNLNQMSNPNAVVTYSSKGKVHPTVSLARIKSIKNVLTSKKRATVLQHWQCVSNLIPSYLDFDKPTKSLVRDVFSNTLPFEELVNKIESIKDKSKFEFFCDCYKIINEEAI